MSRHLSDLLHAEAQHKLSTLRHEASQHRLNQAARPSLSWRDVLAHQLVRLAQHLSPGVTVPSPHSLEDI